MKRLLIVTIGFGLLDLITSGASAVPRIAAVPTGYRPGQVLVEFDERTPRSVVEEGLRVNVARPAERIHSLDVLVLDVPQGREKEIVSALSKNPNVGYAEPHYLGPVVFFLNDPHFGPSVELVERRPDHRDQAGTTDADVDDAAAWDTATGRTRQGRRPRLHGIDQNRADLSANTVTQKNQPPPTPAMSRSAGSTGRT